MQNVLELSPLNMCKSLITNGPILQAQQLQETTTTDVQGHRQSSWWKLSKPLLQVPPSLEHRQTRTQHEARNPRGGEGGNTATTHTRCIQDPIESIKVLLAPPDPATNPPASLSSICRNRSPIVNYCVGPGRHPAFVAARTAKSSSLPKTTELCFHSFVLIPGIARKNALSLEHGGFFGGYSAD